MASELLRKLVNICWLTLLLPLKFYSIMHFIFILMQCKVLHLGRNNFIHQYGGHPPGKQLGRKGPGGSGGPQAEHEPAICPYLQSRQTESWAALGKVLPACQSPLLIHTWSTASSSGLPSTREAWTYWRESNEGPQWWWRDWRTSHKRKGWERWDCSAWRIEGSGKIWRENARRIEPSSFQCCLVIRGYQHKLKHSRFPLNIRKHFFFVWGWLNTGTGCPGRLWSLPV